MTLTEFLLARIATDLAWARRQERAAIRTHHVGRRGPHLPDHYSRVLAKCEEGRVRSAGTHSSRRAAERAGNREEQKVLAGNWHDNSLGAVSFQAYVEGDWLPSKHIEATTLAAYDSNLHKHFFPFFGKKLMYQITSSLVQDSVTKAAADGLSPRSIRKYHTMLHSIFQRAVRDQLIVTNPCAHTELPKIIARKSRTLTPTEYELLISTIPDRHRLLVETAIETGMRWGELIALRPRHFDFLRHTVTVEETILEVSKKHSPTGERYVSKPYPKDNEPRTSASTNTSSKQRPFTSRHTASAETSSCSQRLRVHLHATESHSRVGMGIASSLLTMGPPDLEGMPDNTGHACLALAGVVLFMVLPPPDAPVEIAEVLVPPAVSGSGVRRIWPNPRRQYFPLAEVPDAQLSALLDFPRQLASAVGLPTAGLNDAETETVMQAFLDGAHPADLREQWSPEAGGSS